ncbi:hypothetical protein B6E66_14095 [Streptomyces maremycinicus]|nr:hypothetical protein B6E66_14095 [Streptomyces sp. B9173]
MALTPSCRQARLAEAGHRPYASDGAQPFPPAAAPLAVAAPGNHVHGGQPAVFTTGGQEVRGPARELRASIHRTALPPATEPEVRAKLVVLRPPHAGSLRDRTAWSPSSRTQICPPPPSGSQRLVRARPGFVAPSPAGPGHSKGAPPEGWTPEGGASITTYFTGVRQEEQKG